MALTAMLAAACSGPTAQVPAEYGEASRPANIFPDYTDVVIPPNIAPLNFMLKDTAVTAVVASFQGKGEALVVGGGEDAKVEIDTTRWRNLLRENRGGDIRVSLYARKGDSWKHYPDYTLTVAEEDIDGYLSYRLIEPGYELYRQLGLYQRDLTNWDVRVIYENNRKYSDKDNHCINCHNYRNYGTDDMLFHVRAGHGGTIVVHNGEARKVLIKDSTIITSGVYPSWPPTERLVAFSTNKTGQTFHVYHDEKIEVLDETSDLLLYDAGKNEVSHILRTRDQLETFPCWAPDGRRLYYCCAELRRRMDTNVGDSVLLMAVMSKHDSLYYDLCSIDFDPATRRFGEPRMEVDAAARHKSLSVPRVSPDGRYLLFTLGDYGQFHIWHKSADLWLLDLLDSTAKPLHQANSPDADSYHGWSSSGRWIVFASRRDDGNHEEEQYADPGKQHTFLGTPERFHELLPAFVYEV